MATPKKLLKTRDLEAVFGVTSMTVHNWRKGSVTREPLPVDEKSLENGDVRFHPTITARWAKRNDVLMAKLIGDVTLAGFTRPGPKPRSPVRPG